MGTIGSGDDSVRPRSVWRARRLTGSLVLTLAVALTNSALTPLPTVGAGVRVPEAFVGAVNVVPGSGMFQTVIPLSGAEPAFPANPGLIGSETLVGVPPGNFDFTAAPIELGVGPSNADLSSGPIVATVLPVNAGFESGGLAGWETAGSPTTIAANGGTAGWLRESVDRLITSPVIVESAASELQVDVGHTPSTGYSWLQIYVRSGPTYATSTLLDSVYCYNCGGTWNQRSFSLAAYAGQSVKIEFRAYLGNDVAVDNVAVTTAGPIPNWESSGNVKHVVENDGVLRVDGSSSYALSDAFTVAPTANRMTFRVRAESVSGGQVTVKVRHGAGHSTVTQVFFENLSGTSFVERDFDVSAYAGQSIRLEVRAPYRQIRVDDIGLQRYLVPSWTVVGGNPSYVDDGAGGQALRTNGGLISAPFDVPADAQHLMVRMRGTHPYDAIVRSGPNFATQTDAVTYGHLNATAAWRDIPVPVGEFAGQQIRLELRRWAGGGNVYVDFDTAGQAQRVIDGWEVSEAGAVVGANTIGGTYVTPDHLAKTVITSEELQVHPSRLYRFTYDAPADPGFELRINWTRSDTGQSYVIQQTASNDAVPLTSRTLYVPDRLGDVGRFDVEIFKGVRLYEFGGNLAAVQAADPVRDQRRSRYRCRDWRRSAGRNRPRTRGSEPVHVGPILQLGVVDSG